MGTDRTNGTAPDAIQAKAIGHSDGPLLLGGNAGTGKTWALVRRAMRLVGDGKTPVSRILVIASTPVLAKGLDRSLDAAAKRGSRPKATTPTKLAMRILADAAKRSGKPIDTTDGEVAQRVLALFRTDPAFKADWTARYRHVLVDDGQDLTVFELDLLSSLARDRDLTVAFDPDARTDERSRNAMFSLVELQKRVTPTILWAAVCHRSGGRIMAAAMRVLLGPGHRPRRATCALGPGSRVRCWTEREPRAELERVSRFVEAFATLGFARRDMAVFCPTPFMAKAAQAVLGGGKPASRSGGVSVLPLADAKGRPFPIVFIIGWDAGLIPRHSTANAVADDPAERSLLYVAMTRASRHLILTRSACREHGRFWTLTRPSPYWRDLGVLPIRSSSDGYEAFRHADVEAERP